MAVNLDGGLKDGLDLVELAYIPRYEIDIVPDGTGSCVRHDISVVGNNFFLAMAFHGNRRFINRQRRTWGRESVVSYIFVDSPFPRVTNPAKGGAGRGSRS